MGTKCMKRFAILFLCPFRFLSDYDEQFPIADDVSLLQQALPVMYPYQPYTSEYLRANINSSRNVDYTSAYLAT